MTRRNDVSVCICTYKRPEMLRRLLAELQHQKITGGRTFSIVVSDNDSAQSAEPVVAAFAQQSSVPIAYCCETRQNIALARNKALQHANGEYIAFIDDDEFPAADWIENLLRACNDHQAAGVLGPVRPHFEKDPPSWIIKGRFCERPEHPTGTVMPWTDCRTGNLLFRRAILEGEAEAFKPEFGTGGEDKDFFMRMNERTFVFVWCNEGIVYETVPPSRWTREYMLRRALLRGRNILKHPTGRARIIATSVVATPLYTLILPVTFLLGPHHFMKYCIKFCDHFGRLLAIVGLNRFGERQM
jgi:succinoglycan biosynthesis protein ExoM